MEAHTLHIAMRAAETKTPSVDGEPTLTFPYE